MRIAFSFQMTQIFLGLEGVVPYRYLVDRRFDAFNHAFSAFYHGNVEEANSLLAPVNADWPRLRNGEGIKCSAADDQFQLVITCVDRWDLNTEAYVLVTVYTTDGGKGGYSFRAEISFTTGAPEHSLRVAATILSRMIFQGGKSRDFAIDVSEFDLDGIPAPQTAAELIALAATRMSKV